MKGTLTKAEKGWVVNYNYSVNKNDWQTLSLHSDDVKILNNYGDYSVDWDGIEVEFEMVTRWEYDRTTYAKLIHHPVDTNEMIDHIGEVNEMVNHVPDVGKMVEDVEKLAEKYPYGGREGSKRLAFIDGYNTAKETLYTEEQVRDAIDMARSQSGYVSYEFKENEIIQSLKQPKQ
jgi:hypothetical protein